MVSEPRRCCGRALPFALVAADATVFPRRSPRLRPGLAGAGLPARPAARATHARPRRQLVLAAPPRRTARAGRAGAALVCEDWRRARAWLAAVGCHLRPCGSPSEPGRASANLAVCAAGTGRRVRARWLMHGSLRQATHGFAPNRCRFCSRFHARRPRCPPPGRPLPRARSAWLAQRGRCNGLRRPVLPRGARRCAVFPARVASPCARRAVTPAQLGLQARPGRERIEARARVPGGCDLWRAYASRASVTAGSKPVGGAW
jgi:hypothetical protein